jgi:hypothetical protein
MRPSVVKTQSPRFSDGASTGRLSSSAIDESASNLALESFRAGQDFTIAGNAEEYGAGNSRSFTGKTTVIARNAFPAKSVRADESTREAGAVR